MRVIPASIFDCNVLALFSLHDDTMIDFLGDDSRYYTRYGEHECIEHVWVAYVEDVAAGCIAYRTKSNGIGEVKRLFVMPEYRGRGISKILLQTLEQCAQEKGDAALFLDTRITLEPAVSLYRSFGFEITFQQGLYIQMEKRLQ